MALRLTPSKHEQIQHMLRKGFTDKAISEVVPCTRRSLRPIRSKFERFGTTTMPSNRTGPEPRITPTMGDALFYQLAEEPDMNQHGMADFIRSKFNEEVSVSTIARALQRRKISYKVMRRVAQQQNPDIQHFYYYRLKMLACRSYIQYTLLCVFSFPWRRTPLAPCPRVGYHDHGASN